MMPSTATIVCALAASTVALASTDEETLQPSVPVVGIQQPAEVGYAPQVLVAAQQYAADKSREPFHQGGLARAGSNSAETSSEEALLSNLFDGMDSSKMEEFSSGAGRQFSPFNLSIAGIATITASLGVTFAYF